MKPEGPCFLLDSSLSLQFGLVFVLCLDPGGSRITALLSNIVAVEDDEQQRGRQKGTKRDICVHLYSLRNRQRIYFSDMKNQSDKRILSFLLGTANVSFFFSLLQILKFRKVPTLTSPVKLTSYFSQKTEAICSKTYIIFHSLLLELPCYKMFILLNSI